MYMEEIENLALMQILCINRNKIPGAQITKRFTCRNISYIEIHVNWF